MPLRIAPAPDEEVLMNVNNRFRFRRGAAGREQGRAGGGQDAGAAELSTRDGS
jgi:hypothetical protein